MIVHLLFNWKVIIKWITKKNLNGYQWIKNIITQGNIFFFNLFQSVCNPPLILFCCCFSGQFPVVTKNAMNLVIRPCKTIVILMTKLPATWYSIPCLIWKHSTIHANQTFPFCLFLTDALCCIHLHLHFINFFHNNANNSSFWLQRHGTFLHPIVFACWSNSVVNPCPRLGFSEINYVSTSSTDSGLFCLAQRSFVHHLIDVSPLYCQFVGQYWSICSDNLVWKSQKKTNPSVEHPIQDQDHHHRFHCTFYILQCKQWLKSSTLGSANTSNNSKKCYKILSFFLQHQQTNTLKNIAA